MLKNDADRKIDLGGICAFDHVQDARDLAIRRRGAACCVDVFKIRFGCYFQASRRHKRTRRISR
jgi:hypothetical protein